MTRQVSHNYPRNVERRMERDSRKLPVVEQQVDELQQVVVEQANSFLDAAVEAIK